MKQILSESRYKALIKAQNTFNVAATNPLYQTWRKTAIDSFSFYDGTGQYPPEILKILEQRGQSPIVVNKVRSMINQASGTEINTRGKIAFRPQSYKEEEAQLAKAMTHYGYAVQKDEAFSFKGSLRCRDAMICGLGWASMYPHRKKFCYGYEHPLNIIYDADDFTPQLTNSRYVFKMHWMPLEEIQSEWPKEAKLFDDMVGFDKMLNNIGNYSPEFFNRNSVIIPSSGSNSSNDGSKLIVIEMQYKEKRKYYCGIDKNGYYFETFDEEIAEELAESKKDIEQEMGTQIMRTVFCNDILLEYAPLLPNMPNRKDFSYIPCVWSRRTSDAVPVGELEHLKDLQRELNLTKLKYILSLNSKTAIIDHNAFHGMDIEEIRQEVSRIDGVLLKTGPGDVQIMQNIDISQNMISASQRIDHELQQVSGQYSDALGEATNATSGIAINKRQIASAKNLSFGFDAFTFVKEREGKVLIDLMQGSGLENILVNITLDDDEKEQFVLNLVRDINGKQVMFNDMRTLPVDIYVEIVPDYDSSFEEQKSTLETLLANPQAPLILQNPYLLKILIGERNSDKISEAMQQLNQQQEAMRTGAPNPGGGDMQEVSPTQIGAM